jgi:hypothetical protein
MNPLNLSAQFAAYVWYTEVRQGTKAHGEAELADLPAFRPRGLGQAADAVGQAEACRKRPAAPSHARR